MLQVMIVDDSHAVCAVWRDLISRITGLHLAGIYESPLAALNAICCCAPDVILLDIELGTESGSQVLRFAASNFPEIKVIVVSNHADKIYRKHYINAGAYAFFDKTHELHKMRGLLLSFAEAEKVRTRSVAQPDFSSTAPALIR